MQKKIFKYCFAIHSNMHTITLKLQGSTVKKVEKLMNEFDYSTKTDFIREAIREKLKRLERERAWKKFEKLKGTAPVKYSDEESRRIREKVGGEFIQKFKD